MRYSEYNLSNKFREKALFLKLRDKFIDLVELRSIQRKADFDYFFKFKFNDTFIYSRLFFCFENDLLSSFANEIVYDNLIFNGAFKSPEGFMEFIMFQITSKIYFEEKQIIDINRLYLGVYSEEAALRYDDVEEFLEDLQKLDLSVFLFKRNNA